MDNGTMFDHVGRVNSCVEDQNSPYLQTPTQQSISLGYGPVHKSAIPFKSNSQSQRRPTYPGNNIWLTGAAAYSTSPIATRGQGERESIRNSTLTETIHAEVEHNGYTILPFPKQHFQQSSSQSDPSPERLQSTNSNISLWNHNHAFNVSEHPSSFARMSGQHPVTRKSDKMSNSPVEANGSDLLNGSAPDVDGELAEHPPATWRVSATPGYHHTLSIEPYNSKPSSSESWVLTKGFETHRNTASSNKFSSPYAIQSSMDNPLNIVPAVENTSDKSIMSLPETMHQRSSAEIAAYHGMQGLPPKFNPLPRSNLGFDADYYNNKDMLANASLSNNRHSDPRESRQHNFHGQHTHGVPAMPPRHQIQSDFSYLNQGGLNLTYGAYDAAGVPGQAFDGQRTYPRTGTLVDRETLTPATSDYRGSWRSPDYSASVTPLTGPGSVRSSSGFGYGSRSIAHDPMLLERKLRGLDMQSRDQTYPGSINPAQHHLSYAAGMRMNPLANPYISSHLVPSQAINHNAQGYGRFAVRERDQTLGARSSLLEDFRLQHKTGRRYELKDIYNHIVEFSGDQHGSRFIQQKLETANSDEKEQVFTEIQPNALQLMTDVFGNYVIQKMFEHGSQSQKKVLANQMKGHILFLSTQMYGCRVVQKALEHVLVEQQASIVKELEGDNTIMKVITDGNGNHVIQKAIERVPGEYIQFIVDAHRGQVAKLAIHTFGCRVIQRMLEFCRPHAKRAILDELHQCIPSLIINQFGNYVVQHIIQNGEDEDRRRIVDLVQQNLLNFSKHKFASNVVEKGLEHAGRDQRAAMLSQLTSTNAQGQTPVLGLLRDQYGNYVIQKVVAQLQGAEKEALLDEIKNNMAQLRRTSYGKQVIAIEKLIFESDVPPSLANSSQSSTAPSVKSNSTTDEHLNTHPPPLLQASDKDEVLTNSDGAPLTH